MLKAAKFLGRYWTGIAFSLIALLTAWLALSSDSFHECMKTNDAEAAKQGLQNGAAHFVWLSRWCLGVFVDRNNLTITTIATVGLVYVTYLLVKLGKGQEHTMRVQLRPYVSAYAKEMSLLKDNRTVRIFVHMENHGQTPAYEARIFWLAAVRSHPIDAEITVDSEEARLTSTKTIVHPKGEPRATAREFPLTDAELANIRAGTHALYVSGFFVFLDGFGTKDHGTFNQFIDPRRFQRWWESAFKDKGLPIDPVWQISPYGNTANAPQGR